MNSVSSYFISSLLVGISIVSGPWANANPCDDLGEQSTLSLMRATMKSFMAEEPDEVEVDFVKGAWKMYRAMAKDRKFAAMLPPRIIAEVLGNLEMYDYSQELYSTLSKVNTRRSNLSEALKAAMREQLQGVVPKETIESRIDGLSEPTLESVRRALGDMSLEEVSTLFYGSDHEHPSDSSSLGRFIKKTGAATLLRAFPLRPGGAKLGPKRLVVAVSAQSFPEWSTQFFRHEYMSVIDHAVIVHRGLYHPYSGVTTAFALSKTVNKILPIVVLKTTEAQRLTQFLRADEKYRVSQGGWTNDAQQPWRLDNYCATSHYTNCTQKIGNMPIGDKTVTAYSFPGNNDRGAAQRPITRKLKPYDHPDPLIRRVWKIPGNEQFADVIGQRQANLTGEFANPGWVISTLIGPTSAKRVPVVFVIREDHTAPIEPDFVPGFELPQ